MVKNIFTPIPDKLPEELIENLLLLDNIRIERIVSKNHSTPVGQWYDQDTDEWVILLQGQAILCYEHLLQQVTLNAGDYVFIPKHIRHRVEWTPPETETVWLAVHILN